MFFCYKRGISLSANDTNEFPVGTSDFFFVDALLPRTIFALIEDDQPTFLFAEGFHIAGDLLQSFDSDIFPVVVSPHFQFDRIFFRLI